MRSHSGVAGQMFRALAEAGVNIELITTSEIKISVLVDRNQCDDAVRAVHEGFGLSRGPTALPSTGRKPAAGQAPSAISRDQLERDVVARLLHMEDIVVSEVALDLEQARVTIRNLPDLPGVSAAVFTAVAEAGVMVDMIVQNIGRQGQAHLSLTMPRNELDACLNSARRVIQRWQNAELTHEPEIAKLSVMGIGLRSHTGVGERTFRALADAGINVQMINTSEVRVSAVVAPDRGEQALQCLLKSFGLAADNG
jgi:aspartate kinase